MNLPSDQKFFVFDCESVGLHGQTFAVAGGVYDTDGHKAGIEFSLHCAPGDHMGVEGRTEDDRKWVQENVSIIEDSFECVNPEHVRAMFWKVWQDSKTKHPGILMFVECGWPVEARFLLECIADDPVSRNWEGPYPMHEIASVMLAAGMDPMGAYDRLPDESPPHEPLADARLSARLLATAVRTLRGRAALPPFEETVVGKLTVAAKTFRKDLDDVLQRMKAHRDDVTTPGVLLPGVADQREMVANHILSLRHVEDAVMRQGMVLKCIGANTNPYPQSYNPESKDIEPTADGLKL